MWLPCASLGSGFKCLDLSQQVTQVVLHHPSSLDAEILAVASLGLIDAGLPEGVGLLQGLLKGLNCVAVDLKIHGGVCV